MDILNKGGAYNDIIHWVGDSSTKFRISDPKTLSKLWGITKKKNNMDYPKMARAIRYGYNTSFKKCEKDYEYEFIL